MVKVEKTVELSEETVKLWEEVLGRSDFHPYYGKNEVIDSITVMFGDGFEADIKLFNGDFEGPYIEPVMFKDGFEFKTYDVAGELLGDFVLNVGGVAYIAHVVEKS